MSAYQYFEFQAADRRPITEREMATLRGLSSRATIIPTRFVKLAGRGRERPEPRATVRAAQHLLLLAPGQISSIRWRRTVGIGSSRGCRWRPATVRAPCVRLREISE